MIYGVFRDKILNISRQKIVDAFDFFLSDGWHFQCSIESSDFLNQQTDEITIKRECHLTCIRTIPLF